MNDNIRLLREECRKNIASVTQLYFDTYLSYKQIGKELSLSPSTVRDIIEGNIPESQRILREQTVSTAVSDPQRDQIAVGMFEATQADGVMAHYNSGNMSYVEISRQPDILINLYQVTEVIKSHTTPEERKRHRVKIVKERQTLATFRHIKATVTIAEPLKNRLLYSLRVTPGMTIAQLQTIYLFAINTTLPSLAKQNQWPIHLNHCFARVVLDTLFRDSWYNHLDRSSPAYRQLKRTQLLAVISIIEGVVLDPSTLAELNELSKSYRSNS